MKFVLALFLSLTFLFAQENGGNVPCGAEPMNILALRQTADAGDSTAQYLLGMHYAFGSQKDEQLTQSVYWFQKSAEQGYSEAEYKLGQAYASGRGVHNGSKAAFYWYRKAALDGAVNAQFSLGLLFFSGID